MSSLFAEEFENNRELWIVETKQLFETLPPSHYRLFGYLANYLSKYEARHGRSSGVCGVFAPVVLPHVPPATTLLRDILAEASDLFRDWWVTRHDFISFLICPSACKCYGQKSQSPDNSLLCEFSLVEIVTTIIANWAWVTPTINIWIRKFGSGFDLHD